MRLIFCHDNTYPKGVEYAFRILSTSLEYSVEIKNDFRTTGCRDVIIISYGSDIPFVGQKNHLHIFSDSSFWGNLGNRESFPRSPMYRFPLKDLQLTRNEKLEDPLVFPYLHSNDHAKPVYWKRSHSKNNHILVCEIDLLASAFFWVTRYEETLIRERDEFGRIPEERLCCVREKCYSRPLVDEYTEALRQLLNQFGHRISARQAPLRVLITHDVDSGIPVRGRLEHLENGLRSLYREVVRERRVWAGLTNCLQWFFIAIGWRSYTDLYDVIIQIDRKYGFTSHFFIMANGTHSNDAPYSIYSKYSRKVIETIRSNGGQIALHLGINSHRCFDQFKKEWNSVREVFPDTLPASRSHCLVFPVPDTWDKLCAVNCRVDTTLGFSKYMGFRAGTSRPFRPFDVLTQNIKPMWEYPMIIMDKHLFSLDFRSDSERINQALKIIDKVAAHGGCLVINWHNVFFFSDYLSMYTAILNYVAERGKNTRLCDGPEPLDAVIW